MNWRYLSLYLLVAVLMLGMLTSAERPFVKLRNIEYAPGQDYTIQSAANGQATWVAGTSGAIDVNLTPIAYIPTASGNTDNLNEVVTDPNGSVWVIDAAGDALQTGSGGGGGGSPTYSNVTLSASGQTSMFVRYAGETAPTLSQTAVGQYTLAVPANTILLGFHWTANSSHTTGSNATELTITTTAQVLYANYTIINATTGSEFGQQQGIVVNQTTPAAGQVKAVFPNMSNFGAGGFIIVGKPV